MIRKIALVSSLAVWASLASINISSARAETFKVDTGHSTVGFKVKHLVISTVNGRFNKFDGTFLFDEKTKTFKNVKLSIDANSIDTNEPDRDKHLKSADFFDTAKFATISLDLASVKIGEGNKATAKAKLKIRDVEKEIPFKISFGGTANDPWGNRRLAVTAEAKINRKDFGVSWNKSLDHGGVMVSEDVELLFEGEAISVAEVTDQNKSKK